MSILNNYEGNVLDITDEQVSNNWRLGVLRHIGQSMSREAYYIGLSLTGDKRIHAFSTSRKNCAFSSIYSIQEKTISNDEEYSSRFVATASCSCGILTDVKIAINTGAGDFFAILN